MANTSKLKSTKSIEMIRGGGSGDGSGPTSSPRTYLKGGKGKTSAGFSSPMTDKKRGGTSWGVGGV